MNDLFKQMSRIAYAGHVPKDQLDKILGEEKKLTQDEILNELTKRADGPVTRFVVISRAVEIAKRSDVTAEDCANALYEALTIIDDCGFIPSNEFNR